MDKIELNKCQKDKIAEICAEFHNSPGELINVLHKAQGHFGYLPEEVQREIARCLHIPVAKVYGVVTFYSFFTMQPKGRHSISVCMGTACYVRGAEGVLEERRRSRRSSKSTWAVSPPTESSPWSACAAWVPAVWPR